MKNTVIIINYYTLIIFLLSFNLHAKEQNQQIHFFLDISNSMKAKHKFADLSMFDLSILEMIELSEEELVDKSHTIIKWYIINTESKEYTIKSIDYMESIVGKIHPGGSTNIEVIFDMLNETIENNTKMKNKFYIFSDLLHTQDKKNQKRVENQTVSDNKYEMFPAHIYRKFTKLEQLLKQHKDIIIECYDISGSGKIWSLLNNNRVHIPRLLNRKLFTTIDDLSSLCFYYDQDNCYQSKTIISGFFPKNEVSAYNHFSISAELPRFPDVTVYIDNDDLLEYIDFNGGFFDGTLKVTLEKSILKKVQHLDKLDLIMNFSFKLNTKSVQKASMNIIPNKRQVKVIFRKLPEVKILKKHDEELEEIIYFDNITYNKTISIPVIIKWNNEAHDKALEILNDNNDLDVKFNNNETKLKLNNNSRSLKTSFKLFIEDTYVERSSFLLRIVDDNRQFPIKTFNTILGWAAQKMPCVNIKLIKDDPLIVPCNTVFLIDNFFSMLPKNISDQDQLTVYYELDENINNSIDEVDIKLYHSNGWNKNFSNNFFTVPLIPKNKTSQHAIKPINVGLKLHLHSNIERTFYTKWHINADKKLLNCNKDKFVFSKKIQFLKPQLVWSIKDSNNNSIELKKIDLTTLGESISTAYDLNIRCITEPYIDLVGEGINLTIENISNSMNTQAAFIEDIKFDESKEKTISAEQLGKNSNIYFDINIDHFNWIDRHIRKHIQTGKIRLSPYTINRKPTDIEPLVIDYVITKLPAISVYKMMACLTILIFVVSICLILIFWNKMENMQQSATIDF